MTATTTTTNMPRTPAKRHIPIDECLFGPDRTCPPNVCEAVLTPVQHQSRSQRTQWRNSSTSSTTATSSSPPTTRNTSIPPAMEIAVEPCSSPTPSPGRSRKGLDDLEDGRWEAAMHSPERAATTKTTRANGDSQQQPQQSTQQQHHTISLVDLRRLASQGIVDDDSPAHHPATSHRPIAWRVLLGYLPPDTSQWKTVLLEHRRLYRSLVSELFFSQENHHYHHQEEEEQEHGSHVVDEQEPPPVGKAMVQSKGPKEQASLPMDDPSTMQGASASRMDTTRTSSSGSEHTATDIQRNNNEDHFKNEEHLSLDRNIPSTTPTYTRRRSNSIGGSTPEDVGRLERRMDLVGPDEALVIPSLQIDTNHNDKKTRMSVAAATMDDGYEALVPARIREEWKRSGRDAAALAGMRGGHGLNALRLVAVPKDDGDAVDLNVESNKHEQHGGSPLDNNNNNNKWYQFFESAALLDEIRKDVVRTHPDLFFFLEPEHNLGQRRYAALERILFVWAKLNKGVRYVQGMNEIVGTLYYVLANDLNEEWACEAEADTYFLFNNLMTEMRDVFVPALDDADTGIQGRIANMKSLLSLHDPEVSCHLDDCGIDTSFYAIRWLTTLLSREFLLPDTIRLWDSAFASTHKDNFLRYVCVTMVMAIRDDLLKGDFSTCLRLLQSYPPTDLDHLLESSRALWIYESQVTLACHKGGISLRQALSTISPPPAIVMAYGLPGGVAYRPSDEDNGAAAATGSLSTTGRNLVKGARSFLGGLSREVGNLRRNRSTDS